MSVDIERDALHWMLRSRPSRVEGVQRLGAHDFADIVSARIFVSLRALHDEGRIVEPSTVAHVAQCSIDTVNALWFDRRPWGTDRQCFDEILVAARKRRAFAVLSEIEQRRNDPTLTDEWLSNKLLDAQQMALPRDVNLTAVDNVDTMIDSTDTAYHWLMPWMLERGERMMIVAPEGSGKTVLLRQLAFQAAAGCHWATNRITKPFTTLYVDAENSRVNTVRAARRLRELARGYASGCAHGWDADRLRIQNVHNLNLVHDRRQRDEVEAWIELYRPDLLIIGPIYKIGRNTPGQSFEDNALAFTDIMDDWRHRYDLAIAMEHHAPKQTTHGERDLGPFGSSVWKRWPDIGISLSWSAADDTVSVPRYDVHPFRGYRGTHHFPPMFLHGDASQKHWPWMPRIASPDIYERGDEYATF